VANGNLWGTSGTNVRFSNYTAANQSGNYGADIQVANNGYLAMVLNMINSITAYV
jgi:hypothetical protein